MNHGVELMKSMSGETWQAAGVDPVTGRWICLLPLARVTLNWLCLGHMWKFLPRSSTFLQPLLVLTGGSGQYVCVPCPFFAVDQGYELLM